MVCSVVWCMVSVCVVCGIWCVVCSRWCVMLHVVVCDVLSVMWCVICGI